MEMEPLTDNFYGLEGDMSMNNLRLAFDAEGEKKDITLPMEEWISDWIFDHNIIPGNDTKILLAEIQIVTRTLEKDFENFEAVARHFCWKEIYDDFINTIEKGNFYEKNSFGFKEWVQDEEWEEERQYWEELDNMEYKDERSLWKSFGEEL